MTVISLSPEDFIFAKLHPQNFTKINPSRKFPNWQIKKFLALSLSSVWFALLLNFPVNSYGHVGMVSSPNHTFKCLFIMLINVKMPTIVGILTFMSRINSMLTWVKYKKKFITSGRVILQPPSQFCWIYTISRWNVTLPRETFNLSVTDNCPIGSIIIEQDHLSTWFGM